MFHDKNLMQLVGTIAAMYDARKGFGPDNTAIKPSVICVDGIGMGAGVVDRGRELGLPMVSVNVAEHQSSSDRHFNLKAELWWKARSWLDARDCRMPNDINLVRGLTVTKIKHHSSGKLMVESKDEMKRRLGAKMPRMDATDSFILTFAAPAAIALHGSQAKNNYKQDIRRNLKGVV
jgi:hypothetical protein